MVYIIKLVITILGIYLGYKTATAPFIHTMQPTFEGYSRLALPPILSGIGAYLSITTIINVFVGTHKSSKQTQRSIGTIINIAYSSFRINNEPRFRVTVKYQGYSKIFDPISSTIQLNFSAGDSVVIFYDPEKIDSAYLDINESIKHINKASEIAPNAMFKILKINPVFSIKEDSYEIIGEVHSRKENTFNASLYQKLTTEQASKLIPGTLIPCTIEGETDKHISMIIN